MSDQDKKQSNLDRLCNLADRGHLIRVVRSVQPLLYSIFCTGYGSAELRSMGIASTESGATFQLAKTTHTLGICCYTVHTANLATEGCVQNRIPVGGMNTLWQHLKDAPPQKTSSKEIS